jgi:hypothetical protein
LVGAQVEEIEGLAEAAANIGAETVEFDAVGFGVGKDGDKATGVGDKAIDGPSGKGEGFSGLPAP